MPFDKEKANRAITFIENLHHTKGKWAGEKFNLMDWQKKIIEDIFGTVKEDGRRQYRTVYIEIPRKNGKTALAAAIANYMLFVESNNDPEAEIYSAAADRDQASLVFNQAASMVRKNNVLTKTCNIIDSQKRIVNYRTGSFYRAIPADAASAHGYNASCVIVDELHTQPNRDLVDTLITSQGARDEPLAIFLTTAGYDTASICYEYHDYARQILDGVVEDETFYPVIYAAENEEEWDKEEEWEKANPNLDETINREFLRQEANKARQVPAYQNTFKRLYLNIWTRQEERVIDLDAWDLSAGTVIPSQLEGQECYAGLDLSSTTDITALELVFPCGDEFKVMSYFWLPQDNLKERIDKDKVPYDAWARQGYLELTEGNQVNYKAILQKLIELHEFYNIKEIAFDRWGATKLQQDMQDAGFEVVEFGQGYASMSGPTKELISLVLGQQLHHGNNPVLRWMVDCLSVKQDPAGNIKPVKPDRQKSSKRIDGIVALIMGLDRAIVNQGQGESVYEDRGVRVL